MPLFGFPVGAPPTTEPPVDETCDGTLHLMTSFDAGHFPIWQYSRKCNKECPVYKASLHDFKGEHKIIYQPLFFRPLDNPDGNQQPEAVDLTGDTEKNITTNRFVLVVDLTADTEEITTNHGYVGSDGYVTGDRCVEHNGTVKKEPFLGIAAPLDNDDPDEAKCSVEAEGIAEVRGAASDEAKQPASDEEAGASTATESVAAERLTGANAGDDRPEDGGASVDELQPEANRLPKHNSGTKSFVHVTTQTTVSNQPTIAQSNTSSSQQPSKVKRYRGPSTGRRPMRVVDHVLENLLAGRYRHRFLHRRQLQYRRKNSVGSDNSSTTDSLCGRTNVIRTGPGVTNGVSQGSSSNTIKTQGASNNADSTSTSIPSVSQNGTDPGVTNAPNSNTTNTQGDSNNSASATASRSSVNQNCPSSPSRENSIPCERLSHPKAIIKSGNTMKAVYSIEDGCLPIIPMRMTIPTLKTFTNDILITDDTQPSVAVTVGNTDVTTTLTTNGIRPTVTTNDGQLRTAIIRNDSSPNTPVTRSGGGQVASITRNESGPSFTISQDSSDSMSTITRNSSGPTSTITSCDSGPSAALTRNDSGLSATITRSDSGPSVITTKDNSNPSIITKNESAPSTITKNISDTSATIIKNSNVQNGTITGNGNNQSTTIPVTYFTGKVGGSNATTATNRCGQTGENDLISDQQRATITENGSGKRAIVTGNGSGASTSTTRNDNYPIADFGVCATNSAVGKRCNTSINSRSDNVMSTTTSRNGSGTTLQISDSELSSTNCRSSSVTTANTPNISNNNSNDNSKDHSVVLTNSSCGEGSSASGAINSAIERNCSTSINSRSELLISSTAPTNGRRTSMPTSGSGQSSPDCRNVSLTSGGVDSGDENDDYVDNDADTVVDDADTVVDDAVTLDDPDEEGEDEDDEDICDDEDSGGVLDSDDDDYDDDHDDDDDDDDDEYVGDGSDHYNDCGGTNNNGPDKDESNVCRNKDTLNKGITHSIQSILDDRSNDMPDRTGSFSESNDTSEDEENTSTNISGCNKDASVELSAPPAIPRESSNDNDVSSHSNGTNKRNTTSINYNVAKRMKLGSAAKVDNQRTQDERSVEYKYIDYIDLTKE